MRKVEWHRGKKKLAEEYQPSGIYFSFAHIKKDGNLVQCHPWVKCRDFLHDAVRASLRKDISEIFGFRFDYDVNPKVDLAKTVMLVTNSGKEDFEEEIKNSVGLLNYFERVARVKTSGYEKISEGGQTKYKSVFLLVGSKMWLTSPCLVSMFSFLIRLGSTTDINVKNKKDLEKNFKHLAEKANYGNRCGKDASYLKSMWNKLHEVVKNRNNLFVKKNGFHNLYFNNHGMDSFHNRSGILSLCTAVTPDTKLNKKVKEMFNV